MTKLFIDTNVVVYAVDDRDLRKHAFARELWMALATYPGTTVSSQVVSESANSVLRLWSEPDEAHLMVDRLSEGAIVVPVTSEIVARAVDGVARHGFSFYDAQIWAAARMWGAPVVLSEDFTDGLTVEGVRFCDPFVEGFDIEALLGELEEG